MFNAIPPRLSIASLVMAVLMAAQMPGWITRSRADEPAGAAAPPATAPTASSPPEVRRALREFDRFLDHHPLLEDQLRVERQLTADKAFLGKNPELCDFFRANPNVAVGLEIYPRYYLNRALLRQACAPVSFRELAAFKDLFQRQPGLEQELNEKPESIRDPAFLESHAALRTFLVQHAALARVFLPPPIPPSVSK